MAVARVRLLSSRQQRRYRKKQDEKLANQKAERAREHQLLSFLRQVETTGGAAAARASGEENCGTALPPCTMYSVSSPHCGCTTGGSDFDVLEQITTMYKPASKVQTMLKLSLHIGVSKILVLTHAGCAAPSPPSSTVADHCCTATSGHDSHSKLWWKHRRLLSSSNNGLPPR